MATIQELLARAQALREETALGSISPERAGSIMYDTLQQINQMQLEGGSLVISKIYASVAAMEADNAPVSDLTGQNLRQGQLVVIVPSDTSSSDMGSVSRYDGTDEDVSSWSFTGKICGYPMDQTPTQGSTRAVTSGGVYEQITQLGQKIDELALGKFYGFFPAESDLPDDATIPGYAYVGASAPYAIYNFDGDAWTNSGSVSGPVAFITPEMFGAVGDGATDDTAALRECFDMNQPVLLKGTYAISDNLILGSSMFGGSIKWLAPAYITENGDNVTIENVVFDGNGIGSIRLLYLSGVSQAVVGNCTFKNVGSADEDANSLRGFITIADSTNVSIKDCTLFNATAKNNGTDYSAYGVSIDNLSQHIRISGCTFKNIISTGSGDGDCVKVLDAAYSFDSDLIVEGCKFDTFSKRALKFQTRGCKSLNNTFVITRHGTQIVDFQAGYGASSGDVFVLAWDGETSLDSYNSRLMEGLYGILVGYCDISNVRCRYVNGTETTLQPFISLSEDLLNTTTEVVKVSVTDCVIDGCTAILATSASLTKISGLTLTGIQWSTSSTKSNYYVVVCRSGVSSFTMERSVIGIDVKNNLYGFISYASAVFSYVNIEFIYSGYSLLSEPFFDSDTLFIKGQQNGNVKYLEYKNGHLYAYIVTAADPSGLTTSAWDVLKITKTKNITVIKKEPVLDSGAGEVTVGYVCTVKSPDSSHVGTYKPLIVKYTP